MSVAYLDVRMRGAGSLIEVTTAHGAPDGHQQQPALEEAGEAAAPDPHDLPGPPLDAHMPAALQQAVACVQQEAHLPFFTEASLMQLIRRGIPPSHNHCIVLLGDTHPNTWQGFGGAARQAAVAAVVQRLLQLLPHLCVYEGLEQVIAAADFGAGTLPLRALVAPPPPPPGWQESAAMHVAFVQAQQQRLQQEQERLQLLQQERLQQHQHADEEGPIDLITPPPSP